MKTLEIKTAKITEKGQISIPKEIRDLEGLKKGKKVAIIAYEDHIEIRPLSKVKRTLLTTFLSEKSLARDWLSEEEERAWKNL